MTILTARRSQGKRRDKRGRQTTRVSWIRTTRSAEQSLLVWSSTVNGLQWTDGWQSKSLRARGFPGAKAGDGFQVPMRETLKACPEDDGSRYERRRTLSGRRIGRIEVRMVLVPVINAGANDEGLPSTPSTPTIRPMTLQSSWSAGEARHVSHKLDQRSDAELERHWGKGQHRRHAATVAPPNPPASSVLCP
jgi:hypothetical protein